MRVIAGIGRFLYDFIIGDDWVGAFGVVVLLGLVAVMVHAWNLNAWWIVPPAVVAVLTVTLRRALAAGA